MSIALMSAAFRAQIPATQKLVLLALCDCANDQGECYPSINLMIGKCSLSERAIQGAISWLDKAKYLRREMRKGRATVYWCSPEAGQPPQQVHPRSKCTPHDVHPTPARRAPPPPQQVHPTPAAGAPRIIIEPSIESSRNHKTLRAPDVSPVVWADWVAFRKSKRAAVTETAISGIQREADKAGWTLERVLIECCQRGWTGFKAEWVAEAKVQKFESRSESAAIEKVIEMSGGILNARSKPKSFEVIENVGTSFLSLD